jgi:hypothetical protein
LIAYWSLCGCGRTPPCEPYYNSPQRRVQEETDNVIFVLSFVSVRSKEADFHLPQINDAKGNSVPRQHIIDGAWGSWSNASPILNVGTKLK